MPKITLENVTKVYQADRRVEAVSDVNLTIEQGEFVFLTGSSGAGKSTVLNLISGQLSPSRGRVLLDSTDLSKLSKKEKGAVSLAFGCVWQEPQWIRNRTITENLALVAMVGVGSGRVRKGKRDRVDERVQKVLGLVGMRGAGSSYPGELSCGEGRRVELARALLNSPQILLLDEITANLDDDNCWDIFQFLNEVNQHGTTIIMATHARRYVNLMRRRVITLVNGQIFGDVQKGRYGEIV